jgi:hypothetical protein
LCFNPLPQDVDVNVERQKGKGVNVIAYLRVRAQHSRLARALLVSSRVPPWRRRRRRRAGWSGWR